MEQMDHRCAASFSVSGLQVEEPLRKKSKYFPDDKKADKQGHADQNLRPKSAQNAESPAKADKRTPKKASGNAAGKSANANKRKLVLDSDSDDDFEVCHIMRLAQCPSCIVLLCLQIWKGTLPYGKVAPILLPFTLLRYGVPDRRFTPILTRRARGSLVCS